MEEIRLAVTGILGLGVGVFVGRLLPRRQVSEEVEQPKPLLKKRPTKAPNNHLRAPKSPDPVELEKKERGGTSAPIF